MAPLSRICSSCKRKRRLEDGVCAECGGRSLAPHQQRAGAVAAERAELRRLREGMENTLGMATRDLEHETHAKRLIMVAGCRRCSSISHRLPAQNWVTA